jgi:hypothetical protein
MRHHRVPMLRPHDSRLAATRLRCRRPSWQSGAGCVLSGPGHLTAGGEMTMVHFFYEKVTLERLRELEALDRQLERWGWFRRKEFAPASRGPRSRGWRSRAGAGLVRLGLWLQGGGHGHPVHGPRRSLAALDDAGNREGA